MDDPGSSVSSALTERAIRKELRSAALQHPATILPLAIAVLSLFHLVGISPFSGQASWAIIPLVVAGIGAAGSFSWIYSIRHDVEYAKKVQEIMAVQSRESREVEEAELRQLRDTLRTGFSDVTSATGLRALADLVLEYEQLQLALDQPVANASLSLARLPGLSEETYRQGLNVLAKGLQLNRTIHTSNKGRLRAEIVDLQKEIETLRKDDSQARRVEILEGTVANRQERLELLNQQQLRVDELFYQCDRCEASLARTRIEVAALQAGTSETSVNAVVEPLQRTIDQAKDVQEEMKKLGF